MFSTKRQLLLLATMLGLVLAFQNCGKRYDAKYGSSELESTSGLDDFDHVDDPPTTPVDPDPEDPPTVTKAYILPTEAVPAVEDSRLDWSFNESNPDLIKAIEGLASQCATRRVDFQNTQKLAPIVYDEGLLPGDPKITEMANVKSAFEKAMNVAFCAYFANTPEERKSSLDSAAKFIVDWNATYVGDGNPINERFFIRLFTIADLLFPLLTQPQIDAIKSLAQRIDRKEIAFMAALPATDLRLRNNWKTRHLMIRYHANLMLNDATKLQEIQTAINQDIAKQYTAPTNFTLSTCANLRSIGSYGSYDLQQRDSFVYHLSGIAELLPLMAVRPAIFNATSRSRLLAALNVTKPYVAGTKEHPEFRCSSVQYDKDKVALDSSVGSNWKPYASRVVYRYARLLWGETEAWTSSFMTTEYAPWFKVFYTGKGDVL